MNPNFTIEFADEVHAKHHRLENLYPDPLVFARNFDDPQVGEIAGLIAAVFAYGRVDQIVKNLEKVFGVIGKNPRKAILQNSQKHWEEKFSGLVYRFHKGGDLAMLLTLLRATIEEHGSLKELFLKNYNGDIKTAIIGFSDTILSYSDNPGQSVAYFVSSPAGGSAAKRLCLYVRWMVRKDQIDPGYWSGAISPSKLVIPLDTHVAKVGKHFGLTSRKNSDWKTAVEITESLKLFDPGDPLKYDFSLFRYGMEMLG